MLASQVYQGHESIHDDGTAEALGFRAGPIEGPTHFSLVPPLLAHLWGQEWFERGCISAHYKNMVIEGEQTRAFAALPKSGTRRTEVWAEKADGTTVFEASASISPDHGETLLENRLKKLRPPGKLRILADLHVGMKGAADERVQILPDHNLGALYPFSLREKLAVITENTPWYADAESSPWRRAIIPLEMVSVLTEYSSPLAQFPVRGPVVGLFADQEIRMIEGPLFVGETYVLRREIVFLSESSRTESYWVRTRIFDAAGSRQVAEVLLNHAVMKQSSDAYRTNPDPASVGQYPAIPATDLPTEQSRPRT
jgi:hypothetical protein